MKSVSDLEGGEQNKQSHYITDRERVVQEALRQSEERFRLLVEGIKDHAILMLDTRGNVISWNLGAERVYGYQAEEIIGGYFSCFYLPDDIERGKPEHQLQIAINEGRFEEEVWGLHKNGKRFLANIILSSLYNERGQMVGFSMITQDLTKQKRVEKEILQGKKLESIGLLATGIVHDYNNILTAVIANIALAKLSLDPNSKGSQQLTAAINDCLRVRNLTWQLLSFSKGDKSIKKIVSMAQILRDSSNFALQGSNIRCELDIPDDLWPIEADEIHISQIIHNIVLNAQQAMPQGGVVHIRAGNITVEAKEIPTLPGGDYIKISINDHGSGIPSEHLDKIFDPFFTTKPRGVGLGLTTSYGIVKEHGGHISIDSEPEIGTTSFIYLPRSRNMLQKKETPQESYIQGKGRILFMDDETSIRELVSEILTLLGYQVVCSQDGAEAIKLYKKAQELDQMFDVVILDLTVRAGLGGRETIQRLLEINPKVKAIISSGYSNDPIILNYGQFGFAAGIAKPYTAENLSNVLAKLLK